MLRIINQHKICTRGKAKLELSIKLDGIWQVKGWNSEGGWECWGNSEKLIFSVGEGKDRRKGWREFGEVCGRGLGGSSKHLKKAQVHGMLRKGESTASSNSDLKL
jgi:hypothetical protein